MNSGLDVVLKRNKNGEAISNVPRTVVHHSPTGYEWGYEGSGPADLALNILNQAVPPRSDGLDPVKCFQGEVSVTAWLLHHDFKAEVLARIPPEGGKISAGLVQSFLRERAAQVREQAGRLSS